MKGGFFMQKSTTIIGILEMLEDGYSYRDIQARFAIGNSTITDIKKKFAAMDIPLKELAVKTPKAIESIFYANSHPRKNIPLPDFSKVYNSLTNKQTKTNLYFIWLDYKKMYPEGYQYTQFKHYFKKWLDENHLEDNLRMVVERIPGEIVYIDWIGDTLDLVLTETNGVLRTAHFFVTTVGVSSYCFAMAFPDEKAESFLQGTIEALHFYKKAPKILKPDNTKAASIKNTKDSLILNKIYEDLQDYYGVVIVPAPPLKPKAKSTVENHVRWLETHLLEKLRGRWFDSFTSLNNEILSIIDELNQRSFSNGKGNRKELFEKYDKPAMKELPSESLKSYSYEIKNVPNNYHIMYDNHYYSVPYIYYKQEVTVKASYFDILICDSMNRLICKHKRLYKPYPKYSTIEEHMPPKHQYYSIENRFDSSDYRRWARSYGENVVQLINKVMTSFNYEQQSYKSCNGILHLRKEYSKAISNKAAENCLIRNTISYSYFKKELQNLANKNGTEHRTEKLPQHRNIRGKEHYE